MTRSKYRNKWLHYYRSLALRRVRVLEPYSVPRVAARVQEFCSGFLLAIPDSYTEDDIHLREHDDGGEG